MKFSWASTTLTLVGGLSAANIGRQAIGNSTQLVTDIDAIRTSWGELSPYFDNVENYFGVQDVGLPDGCQVEQVHTLQRHGARYPTPGSFEGNNDRRFGAKIHDWSTANSSAKFTGPLDFLNGYTYQMGQAFLVAQGASQLFQSGLDFWRQYGRILYNQTSGQLAYDPAFINGSARLKPVLRTTDMSRIENTEINWALGFFGPSFRAIPDPTLANFTSLYDLVIIPEGIPNNNTLAAYDSCPMSNDPVIAALGDLNQPQYIARYLSAATARLQQYAPPGFTLTVNDTYAMQDICAFEFNYYGYSDFCLLFTADEWSGFEQTHDLQYYYDYAFGNPTARAQGIGYVQELIARLTNQYISYGNSSVNATLNDNGNTFPLHRPFYADFTHDDIIVSVLTALSIDYLKDPPNLTQYPPDPARRFYLSHLVPFAARLTTELIGCSSPSPVPHPTKRLSYTPTQYGYNPSNASNKFIRMRLNSGILPLSSIRGGACAGRTDGLCALDSFLDSQKDAYTLSNFQYACFGNYSGVVTPQDTLDWDGTINATFVEGRRGGKSA